MTLTIICFLHLAKPSKKAMVEWQVAA